MLLNPNGIPSISPGLRCGRYPGCANQMTSILKGLHRPVESAARFHGAICCNPFRVVNSAATMTQGGSCLATLG